MIEMSAFGCLAMLGPSVKQEIGDDDFIRIIAIALASDQADIIRFEAHALEFGLSFSGGQLEIANQSGRPDLTRHIEPKFELLQVDLRLERHGVSSI